MIGRIAAPISAVRNKSQIMGILADIMHAQMVHYRACRAMLEALLLGWVGRGDSCAVFPCLKRAQLAEPL